MLVTMARHLEGPWQAEVPISVGAFTLHAIGWRVHDVRIGNAGLVWAPSVDLLLAAPVRFVVRGAVGMLITAHLTGRQDRFPPFVVLEAEPDRPRRVLRPLAVSIDLEEV